MKSRQTGTEAAGTPADAVTLARHLAAREVSAEEVVTAALDRIARLEPTLKAFITVDREGAIATACRLDAADRPVGPLHGLPVAVKDVTDTAGLRTTRGSLLFADNVPAADDPAVARLKAAGAVIVGKTNTPEFGFGAVCTNRIQGPTANPYDPRLTSGGSSGGSAAAVAAGLVPLAQGTDFGGSVRTPAGFCGIVSVRPTPGRIAEPGRDLAWTGLASHGVMARTVADAALMLAAMAGPDPADPLSLTAWPPLATPDPASGAVLGPVRVAATADFGVAPIADAVRHRFEEAVARLAAVAGPVERAHPDCAEAPAAFRTLRAAQIERGLADLVDGREDLLTDPVRWNLGAGRGLTARAYLEAEAARARLWRRFIAFFQTRDVLVAPAASVMPWPHADGEVLEIDGRPLADILDYLTVTFVVSLVGFPVVTLPAPFDDLPFGLQLIGRPGEEARLLAFAARLEAEVGFVWRPPLMPAEVRP
ncbi:amidase [Prosthecodimorpha staleyi]|uniref:Indoleacetamide hydrolase n=1 Tax=Prosthecodimorpha staleyi TaxID=2840188 RepID=A0A947D7N0_9HYPH|nr:amidase [Prosthecodimorpha staleyi]MBT9291609.1 amidase [Prosthecodimorpha staleyi]